MGPVARMMMSVAGQSITGYVQFRALIELLIAKGVIGRDEVEAYFARMRTQALDETIDEWFAPDIAYHLKMAVAAAGGQETTGNGSGLDGSAPDAPGGTDAPGLRS
jgi:hypothetical protein